MDVHVPLVITETLRRRGVNVLRAQEDKAERMEDSALLDRASALKRVLFTQDDDFLVECAKRQANLIPFFGLIYAHQMKITIGQCVRDLNLIANVYDPSDIENRVEYLPLE